MNHKLDYFKNMSKFTVRTSDRRTFRRCLRKWDFQSSLRQNLKRKGTETNIHFWFGSAIHFAMEDFHGYNRYGDPRRALHAYYNAFKEAERPEHADMHYSLGMSMLSYYLSWYEKHNEYTGFETVWFDANMNEVPAFSEGSTPGVEVSFYIPLEKYVIADAVTGHIYAECTADTEAHLMNAVEIEYPLGVLSYSTHMVNINDQMEVAYDYKWTDIDGVIHDVNIVPVMYHGTMDRLVKDKMGRYWILDYKTAKGADTNKLDTDDQISAYLWAASQWLNVPIYGFVYLQLTKDKVQEPRRLKNGDLSVDKKQKTTYNLLRQEIINDYGEVAKAPSKIIDFLNHLAAIETPEGDRFIRWDFVRRSAEQLASTERHIMGELAMMLNPCLYCYPAPTRDCIWDCQIRDICLAMDREDQALVQESYLNYEPRPRGEDGNIEPWRDNLVYPKEGEVLIPIEDLLDNTTLELDMSDVLEGTNGFKFYYEEEC